MVFVCFKYLLKPFDEVFDEYSEGLFSLPVSKGAIFVESLLLVEPHDQEFRAEDLLVVHELHKRGCTLAHFGVLHHKEENYSLEQVLDTDLALLLDQLHEAVLVLLPSGRVDDIALSSIAEEAAN